MKSTRGRKQGEKAGSSAPGSGELLRLERILELMDRHEVAELEWEKSGERLSLRTKSAFSPAAAASPGLPVHAPAIHHHAPADPALTHRPTLPMAAPVSAAAPAPSAAPKAAEASANQKQVVSPFVGTFYRSASPTADPYVREGQPVKRGDVLCIIEAMKLMNEIEAEFPGKVVSCLVENGQPVEFGEPLFLVEV